MYILISGEVGIVLGGRSVDSVIAGSLLRDLGLVDKGPRSATAIARTESRLKLLDTRRFEFMVSQTPIFS